MSGPPAANGVYRVAVGRLDALGPNLNLNASLSPGADSQRPQSGVVRQRAGLYASSTVLACGKHHQERAQLHAGRSECLT